MLFFEVKWLKIRDLVTKSHFRHRFLFYLCRHGKNSTGSKNIPSQIGHAGPDSTLVLSSPAWPNWHKSGQNRVFNTTILSRFLKRLSYQQSYHWCSLLIIDINLSVPPTMGSLVIIVVKLYSYKDSDVGNIQKIKYFHDLWLLGRSEP